MTKVFLQAQFFTYFPQANDTVSTTYEIRNKRYNFTVAEDTKALIMYIHDKIKKNFKNMPGDLIMKYLINMCLLNTKAS